MCMFVAVPSVAEAHGPVAPAATAYLARIQEVPSGLKAQIVDGYVRMWLRVPARDTVIVVDYVGAPYLRFDPSGVAVNQNSAMYYLNEVPAAATPPADLRPSTPPAWHQVSGGHSYEWHDGRLQARAILAARPGVTDLGQWQVPLIIDGRRTEITGVLDHADAPSVLWFWPIVVLLGCVLAAWRLQDAEWDARLARGLTLGALAAITVAALARGLHGRPSVGPVQAGELVLVLAFVAWALRRTVAARPGHLVALITAFVALWEGLNVVPALVRHYVLLALPAFVCRADAVACLGCGLGILLVSFRRAELPGRPTRAGGTAAAAVVAVMLLGALIAGCGSTARTTPTQSIPPSLIAERRVIGVGPRFQTAVSGPVTGPCRHRLGPRIGVHLEVFAANRVVLLPAGIGVRHPTRRIDGRITVARCFGALATIDPTGVVLLRPDARATVADVFRSWGQPLSRTRLLSFTAAPGQHVTAYVGGRPWQAPVGSIPLTRHAEIVLEVGPHVPPHPSYLFPPGI